MWLAKSLGLEAGVPEEEPAPEEAVRLLAEGDPRKQPTEDPALAGKHPHARGMRYSLGSLSRRCFGSSQAPSC
jgi:hypothetical protein